MEKFVARPSGTWKKSCAHSANDKLYEKKNNGNFLKLIELFAKFDLVIETLVSRTLKSKYKHNYLSKDIQNEIIHFPSNSIVENFLSSIRLAKYFSIILDCTPDKGHIEKITIIIRFVCCIEKVSINEHFFGFLVIENSTCESFCNIIINKLHNWNIDIQNIRGQGLWQWG